MADMIDMHSSNILSIFKILREQRDLRMVGAR